MVIRQFVWDNLSSHFEARIQVWLVERRLRDGETLSRRLLAELGSACADADYFQKLVALPPGE
jgi:hypothetical protein